MAPAPQTNSQIEGARDINISGGEFLNVEGNYTHHTHSYDSGIHILFDNIAENALHNASERYPAPNCYPGTREEVLQTLKTWTNDNDADTSLLWLSGKVGTGKSAVMQALVEELQGPDPEKNPIAASFFFGRGKGKRGLGRYLFPTIAYQLALHVPELRDPINRIVQSDPSLPTRSIKTQFQSLIVDPIRRCQEQKKDILARVIVIDGLDECEDVDDMQELIIDLIAMAAQHAHHFPLRFIMASRPEHQICEVFDKPAVSHKLRRMFLESFETGHEIEMFLTDKFSDIYKRKARLMPHVSPSWPGQDVILELVEKAQGQWIYPSTIIKFTDSKLSSPVKQLDIVLDPKRRSLALSPLDNLYTQILSTHPDTGTLIAILGYLALVFDPLIYNVSSVTGLDPDDISITLQRIQSLVDNETLRFFHASFGEFLTDEKRSGRYFICQEDHIPKVTPHAFSSVSTIIIEWIQQPEHLRITCTPPSLVDLMKAKPPFDAATFSSFQSTSKHFETSLLSMQLFAIPLAIGNSTGTFLLALADLLSRFMDWEVLDKVECTEIATPYRFLYIHCLGIVSRSAEFAALRHSLLSAPPIIACALPLVLWTRNSDNIDDFSDIFGYLSLRQVLCREGPGMEDEAKWWNYPDARSTLGKGESGMSLKQKMVAWAKLRTARLRRRPIRGEMRDLRALN